MSKEIDQPKPTDPGAEQGASASGGGAEGASETQKADGELQADPSLALVNEALGRDFKTVEEATKSLKNLNSLVGDAAIQDLKKKAENAPLIDQLVRKLADEKGVSTEEALAQIREDASKAPGPSQEEDKRYRDLEAKIDTMAMKDAEKELLAEHPAASHTMPQLKTLAASTGQSLKEVYETSGLKSLSENAAESQERNDRGTGVAPSARNAYPTSPSNKSKDAYKKDPSGDNADAMVEAALGTHL